MGASLAAGGQLVIAAFDDNGATLAQGAGHLLAGAVQNPLEGPAGDLHPLGGAVLFQPFQVAQAQAFQLFQPAGSPVCRRGVWG